MLEIGEEIIYKMKNPQGVEELRGKVANEKCPGVFVVKKKIANNRKWVKRIVDTNDPTFALLWREGYPEGTEWVRFYDVKAILNTHASQHDSFPGLEPFDANSARKVWFELTQEDFLRFEMASEAGKGTKNQRSFVYSEIEDVLAEKGYIGSEKFYESVVTPTYHVTNRTRPTSTIFYTAKSRSGNP
jgi:hypothetical protein